MRMSFTIGTPNRAWLLKVFCLVQLAFPIEATPQTHPKCQSNDPLSAWGALSLQQLSPQGNWLSFSMGYEQGIDTLFVRPANGRNTFTFAGGRSGAFLGENWFACLTNKGMEVLNLRTGKIASLGAANAYSSDKSNNVLFYASNTKEMFPSLHLQKLSNEAKYTYRNVEVYSYNSNSNTIAVAERNGPDLRILIVALKDFSSKVIYSARASCKSISWQQNGNAVAFLVNGENGYNELVLYNLVSARQQILRHDEHPELIEGIITSDYTPVVISGDGKHVYFQIAPPTAVQSNSNPEIWNASDKVIHPSKISIKGWSEMRKLAVWEPGTDRCRMLTDERFPSVMLAGDLPYAVIWNPFENEPSANMHAPQTYYVLDINSGRFKPLLSSTGGFAGQLSVAPGGKFLSYFREGKWWAYEFEKEMHHDLTGKLPHPFHKESFDWPDEPPAYGIMGWVPSDAAVLLYDRYDVWEIVPGGKAKRITLGRESDESYRLVPQLQEQRPISNFNGSYAATIRLDGPLLFKLRSSLEGYSIRKATGKFERFKTTGDMLSLGLTDNKGQVIAYMRQNHNTPPYIERQVTGKTPTIVYRGNSHYYAMEPFRAELVEYLDNNGKPLQGVLYYPQGYKNNLCYPMIVHIYEKQAWEMQKFPRPSYDNGAGFNIANYIMGGYFVLLPDISYTGNNPGEAAWNCVESSVRSLLGRKDIDTQKIGLIGHSFGGYETDYILTHSKLFAVGVSGAAINDIPSFYHFVVPAFERPNFWHMEYGQFRIGVPYHVDPLLYNQASPLYNSAAISTPLLSWCGKEDAQVPFTQLISLHLSLRRQGKVHTALFYDGEGHTISNYDNRKDLTIRISEWFAHYLKNDPLPPWAEADKY